VLGLLRERRGSIAALRVGTYHRGGGRVVGQRSLGLQAADLEALTEELRAAVSIHNGDEDNNASDHGTKANHTVGG
jgi:hypothetical protein